MSSDFYRFFALCQHKSHKNFPNINIFNEQIKNFEEFLVASGLKLKDQMMHDFNYLPAVGAIFALAAYGQLIIESAAIKKLTAAFLTRSLISW